MKQVLYALPLLLITACVSGPDYHPPASGVSVTPAAQGRFLSSEEATFSQQPLPDRWWHLYDDPRLDAVIERALSANADLRAADANLRKAEAVLRQTRGASGVETRVTAQAAEERDYSESSAGTRIPGVATSHLGLSASYPLDLAGKLKRAIEAGEADRDAVQAARDAVRISVAAATAKAFANVCAANFQIATVQRVIDLQQRTLAANVRLAKNGRGTAFDVSRAQTAVNTSKAALPPLAAKRQASLFLLAALLGEPPANYPRELESCDTLPAISQPLPVGDGRALIRRRPDIRQAERMIAADTARVGMAIADLYPTIAFGGAIETGGKITDLGNDHSFGFSLGPLLSWSFPNRSIVKAQIAAAQEQVAVDLARFDAVILEALRGTETALESYSRTRDRAAALQSAVRSAETSVAQADRLFRAGRADFLSVLAAQNSLAQAKVTWAEAQAAVVDDQIAIFLALGGGWQSSSAQEAAR